MTGRSDPPTPAAWRAKGLGISFEHRSSVFTVPAPENEPELGYLPGTPDRARLETALADFGREQAEIPLVIGGEEVRTGDLVPALVPHRRKQVLANVHQARDEDVLAAIAAAREAWQDWSRWPWEERLMVFMRAAALAAGPHRERLVAATMLDQSKTVYEAEADAACELADFFRFNAHAVSQLLQLQPRSAPTAWNRMDYRALEGFVYAVTPFNFTAIGANLPTAPAMLGNVVIWKPSASSMLAPMLVMDLLREAGLPDGVINLVYGDATMVSEVAVGHPDFAGLHFTGSTEVFRSLWAAVGDKLADLRGFPRLVGETGGKDFVVAHASADPDAVATAVIRGAFEYQGQKCSAASRLYVPRTLWESVSERLQEGIARIRIGDVADPDTYMGAVINEASFTRQREAVDHATSDPASSVVAGGTTDDEEGWFVSPTLVETSDPNMSLLRNELFGPIVTAYVYEESGWADTLDLIDQTVGYGLTGSVFSEEARPLAEAANVLRYAAGNLYLNDKPTGALVGQQPFGGARASGTNDKTGTLLHMSRWASVRTVKHNFLSERSVPYPQTDGRPSQRMAEAPR